MRLPDKTESFHTVFSRPPPGRSAKHALKYECRITQTYFHSFFRAVFLFRASGKRYYPHIGTDHPSANWYNWKESHSEQFIFCISCSFCCCSESDTFLKNFTTSQQTDGVKNTDWSELQKRLFLHIAYAILIYVEEA